MVECFVFLRPLGLRLGELVVGKPVVEGANVSAKVLAQGKAKKILVFKYKRKKDYRKRQGHRQPYTKIQIEKINA